MTFMIVYVLFGVFLGILGARKIPDAYDYTLALIVAALFWPLIIVTSIVKAKIE